MVRVVELVGGVARGAPSILDLFNESGWLSTRIATNRARQEEMQEKAREAALEAAREEERARVANEYHCQIVRTPASHSPYLEPSSCPTESDRKSSSRSVCTIMTNAMATAWRWLVGTTFAGIACKLT